MQLPLVKQVLSRFLNKLKKNWHFGFKFNQKQTHKNKISFNTQSSEVNFMINELLCSQ